MAVDLESLLDRVWAGLTLGRGDLTTLRLAHDQRGWRVTFDRRTSDNFRLLRALDAGLPADEQAKLRANSGASFGA